jgi:hypothetical protein
MNASPELVALLHEYSLLAIKPYGSLDLDQLASLEYYYAELDYRAGLLDNSRGLLLARWIRDVNALENYVASTGTFPRDNRRLPRDAFTPEHRRLITWVNTSIREMSLGNRCNYQVRRLAMIPGFTQTSRDARWHTQLDVYQAFVATHPGVPSTRSGDQVERRLAFWRARQRAGYRRGSLAGVQIESLEAIASWSWN